MLLEICIPTWNRAQQLSILLASIAEKIGDYDLGVFVSDNNSTDNTAAVVAQYQNESWFRCQRHNANMGFDFNVASLIWSGQGTYLWLQGDDDEINFSAIVELLSVLKNEQPSVVWTNICTKGNLSVSEQRGILHVSSLPMLFYMQNFGFFATLGGLAHFVFRRDRVIHKSLNAFMNSNYLHAFMLARSFTDEKVRFLHEALTLVRPRSQDETNVYVERWQMQRGSVWDKAVLVQAKLLDTFLILHGVEDASVFRMYEGTHYPFQLLLLKAIGSLMFAGELISENQLNLLERLCNLVPNPSYRSLANATRLLAMGEATDEQQSDWWQMYRLAGHSDWLSSYELRNPCEL